MYDRFPYISCRVRFGMCRRMDRNCKRAPEFSACRSHCPLPGMRSGNIQFRHQKKSAHRAPSLSSVLDMQEAINTSSEKIDRMLAPYPGDDPVFAEMSSIEISNFLTREKLKEAQTAVQNHMKVRSVLFRSSFLVRGRALDGNSLQSSFERSSRS